MARILLSAYACEPGRGSEPGVGWSWATELASRGHQVTVITRSDNRQPIERHQPSQAAINFLYYDLPRWAQRWRRVPGGKTLYYLLWQYFAARHLRRLFPAPPFDVVQHVTYVSVRYPSFMGSLGIPFWFGPVSGGEGVPPRLRSGFSARQRWREHLRDISNLLVPLDPLMHRTFRQADRILVTRDTLRLIPPHWQNKAAVHLAIGLSDHDPAAAFHHPRSAASGPRLLYVGRLLEWKGLGIALDAASRIKESHPEVRFTIIGDGPARNRLLMLSRKLGLEQNVRWLGCLPQRMLAEHYRTADIFLYPSLRDSGGMVVLEALAHGLPVICTDLGGPGIIVNTTCGRAVATTGRHPNQLADDISSALLEIFTTPNRLESLSCGARARAREFEFQNLVRGVHPEPSPAQVARRA